MSGVVDGDGPERPNLSVARDDGDTAHQRGLVFNLPPSVERVFRQFGHISAWLPNLNARYFYYEAERKRKQEEAAQKRRQEKRQRKEEEEATQKESFPPQNFIVAAQNSQVGADSLVKGSVVLPDCGPVSVSVEGYAFQVESSGDHALVVFHTVDGSNVRYLPTLCPTSLLPSSVVLALLSPSKKKAEQKEWHRLQFNTHPIKRDTQRLHFIKDGKLRNQTCDDAMTRSIREGAVLAIRCSQGKRDVFGVSPMPFFRGKELPASAAFTVQLESGVMHLKCMSRGSREGLARLHACARAARRSVINEVPSKTKALQMMERYCDAAKQESHEIVRLQHLNVALGGPPSFADYGRFAPCKVLAARYTFPSGSFLATPCSCDIVVKGDCPAPIKEAIRHMKPANGNNCGHNYVRVKKNKKEDTS